MSSYLGFIPSKKEHFYFVSYSNKDARRIRKIVRALNDAGIPLWYDYGLKYGEEWEKEIAKRIEKTKAVLLFFTKRILRKKPSYVEVEYEKARELKKDIYVLLVDKINDKKVPVLKLDWWHDISRMQCVNLWEWKKQEKVREVFRALGIDPNEMKYENINYPCPYCGKLFSGLDVLFVGKAPDRYPDFFIDTKYDDFFSWHGVHDNTAKVFDRVYYKVKPGINVIREDVNGFPAAIEDSLSNACIPEDLDKNIKENTFTSDELHRIMVRACPHCRCILPHNLGTIDTHHVLMLGNRDSGKTGYAISLFQDLNRTMMRSFPGSIRLENESASYLDSMSRTMEGGVAPTSVDVVYRGMISIVCEYKNAGKDAFIVINDVPAEGTMDPSFADHQGIKACETLLLLLDPKMFIYYMNLPYPAIAPDDAKSPLDGFLNKVGMMCRTYAHNIKSIICVVTKLDVMFGDTEIKATEDMEFLKDMGQAHCVAVDLQVLDRVDQSLCRYLSKTFGLDLKEKITSVFGSDVFVRVLGESIFAIKDGKFDIGHFDSDSNHRVIEPFLAILADYGLIPAKGKTTDS